MNTKTSKSLLLLLILLGVGVLAIYFINSRPASSNPSEEQSMLTDSESQAQVRGYYRQEERGGGDVLEQETVVCDQFVITEGGEEFSQEYREMIAGGNTVNQIDAQGNLVLNLNLEQVGGSQRERIVSAVESDPIVLELRKVEQGLGRGVGPCYSFVEIVSEIRKEKD